MTSQNWNFILANHDVKSMFHQVFSHLRPFQLGPWGLQESTLPSLKNLLQSCLQRAPDARRINPSGWYLMALGIKG